MKFTYYLLLTLVLYSCQDDETVKRFKLSNAEVVDVSSKIIDMETEQIMGKPLLTISGNYLIMSDYMTSFEKGIHLFDKTSLNYLGSTGVLGEGPGQIIRYGTIAVTPNGKEFWMPDFAKVKIFKFNIDSVLMDDDYLPTVSKSFTYNDIFLTKFKFISEDLALGAGLEALSPGTFRISLGRWDIGSGAIEKFGEEHPRLINERTNAFFDYSYKHGLMALSYTTHDIISVFDADGTIKYHILGEKEFDNENRKLKFFGQIHIGDKQIIVSYLGSERFKLDENQRPKSIRSDKLLVFDLDGTLLKVIKTGHEIVYFAVDEENKRVLCYFLDREVPIGYFHYE